MLHRFERFLVRAGLYELWWKLERLLWQTLVVKSSSLIPHGPYCYRYLDDLIPSKNKPIILTTKIWWQACPYLRNKLNAPEQSYGYCIYLDAGDFDDTMHVSLLWDQCKECGVNDDLDL